MACCRQCSGGGTDVVLPHYSAPNAGLRALILPALGAALALTSVAMIFQPRLRRLGQRLRTTDPRRFKLLQAPLTLVAMGAPWLSGHRHLRRWALGMVMLVYLYPFRPTPTKVVGTASRTRFRSPWSPAWAT